MSQIAFGRYINSYIVLQARANGGELPGIYKASVHIDLSLGLIGRALYKVCSFFWFALSGCPVLCAKCRTISTSATVTPVPGECILLHRSGRAPSQHMC